MSKVLTKEEVAAVCRVDAKTIQWWTRRRTMPFVKIGRTIRYIEEDINRWVEKQRVLPVTNGRPP